MKNIAFFDAKPYDIKWFDKVKAAYGMDIEYFESKLNLSTSVMARGFDAAIAFVNDEIDAPTIDSLIQNGVNVISLRCSGFNNVDLAHAKDKLKIYRVPAYSPSAVAEHAMALLLSLNRKIHRAYNRVRDYNFSLKGFEGFDLFGKTMGVVGTGKIGQAFIQICKGFGMSVLAYDPYPLEGATELGFEYADLEDIFHDSDIIALHCPLTLQNYHMINKNTLSMMKDGVYIINTSRGALINTEALLHAIKTEKVAGAGLDVYEEEGDFFFEDVSAAPVTDDVLKLLLSTPNILITSHQAFLTNEALQNIAETTLQNLKDHFEGNESPNQLVYKPK